MEGRRFLHTIKLRNLLSYGERSESLELHPLNVLIGTNASGKSNLIEALRLLRATPIDINKPIRDGGGILEWLWKGNSPNPVAEIEVFVEPQSGPRLLRYQLAFTAGEPTFKVVGETIGDESTPYYQYANGQATFYNSKPSMNATDIVSSSVAKVIDSVTPRSINITQSVLQQRKDPERYPQLYYLSDQFSTIRIYNEWDIDRFGPLRSLQRTDLPGNILEEDASNLGLILANFSQKTKQDIRDRLKQIHPDADEIITKIEGGTIQILLHEERANTPIPVSRLSGGTLRYLCLLALLLHPSPPALICIEEPEIGLHPDVIPEIAKLLVEASERTQLIITTHSESLVSALANAGLPDAVIVCERDKNGTRLRRLDAERLKKWLEKYSLGELWMMGEIGGTRW
jgi:predicted ATPase